MALMDGLPWPAITAAGGGWALFGMTMVGLITGRFIVTKGEADLYRDNADKAERRAEKAEARADRVEESRDNLVRVVADLTAVGRLQKALVTAKREAADLANLGDGAAEEGPPDVAVEP